VRLRGFGDREVPVNPYSTVGTKAKIFSLPGDQKNALLQLRAVAQPDVAHPLVRERALQMVSICEARNDLCEVEAVFDAVKNGRPDVPGFERGVKYVADPNWADLFHAPHKIIEMLQQGINGFDCDDHTALVCALLGSIGFTTGMLAYGPPGSDEFIHVLAVVKLPKRLTGQVSMAGLDTTVDEATVGWLPPHVYKPDRHDRLAKTLLAWLQ
jgi:hypothetical protein